MVLRKALEAVMSMLATPWLSYVQPVYLPTHLHAYLGIFKVGIFGQTSIHPKVLVIVAVFNTFVALLLDSHVAYPHLTITSCISIRTVELELKTGTIASSVNYRFDGY